MVHVLRCWPEFFKAIVLGTKTCEFRKDDRGFEVGDQLELREFDPSTNRSTGRVCRRTITHVLRDFPPLPPDYVVMSIVDSDAQFEAAARQFEAGRRSVLGVLEPDSEVERGAR